MDSLYLFHGNSGLGFDVASKKIELVQCEHGLLYQHIATSHTQLACGETQWHKKLVTKGLKDNFKIC